MALYKNPAFIDKSSHATFDEQLKPGITTVHAGIYRCVNCGDEIGIAKGHTLPSQNHAQHAPGKPILWQLAVYAEQVK
jgi:hypothetical protein